MEKDRKRLAARLTVTTSVTTFLWVKKTMQAYDMTEKMTKCHHYNKGEGVEVTPYPPYMNEIR